MNNQIKEFAKQAQLEADATYAKGPDSIWLKEYNKKFAELIIRECADISALNGDDSRAAEIRNRFGIDI